MAMLRSATFSLALCLLACLATAEENESKGPDSEEKNPLESVPLPNRNGPVNYDYKAGGYGPPPAYPFYGGPSPWSWPYYGPVDYRGRAPVPYNYYGGWGPQNLDRGFQRPYPGGNGDYYPYGESGENQDKKKEGNE
ncbi:uncharacterized protein LOC144133019 [Amblyomma americanum]